MSLAFDPEVTREDFRGQRVTIVGLGKGRTASGLARFLVSSGASVTITDALPRERLGEGIARLGDTPVKLISDRPATSGHGIRNTVVINGQSARRRSQGASAKNPVLPRSVCFRLTATIVGARHEGATTRHDDRRTWQVVRDAW